MHGTTIVLHLKSEHIKKSTEERLKLLNQTAQTVLNNRFVTFAFEIKEVIKEEKTLYLTKDKIAHYIEKNKTVKTLVDAFNLDL